jgi:cytochrome c oxidase cbb3-type subunit 1
VTATAAKRELAPGTAAKLALFSAVLWFAVGVTFGGITRIKMAYPDFLSGVPWLTFGVIRPTHVDVLILGWISMAFAGAMYYMTPALCNTKLWSERLGVVNIWLWNVGMVVIIATFLNGIMTGIKYHEWIWPIDIYIIFFVMVPLAVNVWMTILHRKTKGIYVSLWFFAACLLMIAVTFLLGSDAMGWTGIASAYMTWWYAHNVLGLWITPVSAAIAYYVIPKVTGNALYSHRIGHIHFWAIVGFYSTPGAHHLMAAPIPEWIKSFASVSGVLILIPALAFITNILLTMEGKWHMFVDNPVVQWSLTGVLFALPLNVQGAFQQTRAINWYIHGTDWIVAHAHMALLGFSTFIEVGAVYYALPRLLGKPLYSVAMARWHFWLTALGFMGFWTSLTTAGLVQAAGKAYNTPFDTVLAQEHPYNVAAIFFGWMIILATWMFLYNMVKTATAPVPVAEREPAAVQATG